jgi:phosphoribosylformimino-5-aminoimidazole carboxamide ribotide isomerase
MIVIPAIDIRGGKVVRLKQGELQHEEVFGSDPIEAAKRWEAEGAERLHIVDLDAVIAAKPQFDVVAGIIKAVGIRVEVGGGLRILENAMRYEQLGADRLIFGTAAVASPGVVQEALRRWPLAVAVALEARKGRVALAGWQEVTTVDALVLAEQVKAWGVKRIQYTDVVRGALRVSPNLEAIRSLGKRWGPGITVAGGISSLEDLTGLRGLLGVDEVVVGKALYERRFSLAEARQAVSGHAQAR